MIKSSDRSWWFGASDTSFVVGNWRTESFKRWWQEKLGMNYGAKFSNKYTLAGTFYEHAILDTINGVVKDKQIVIPKLRIRVNYDGMVGLSIKEVKTYREDKEFKVTKGYYRQAQVEMFAAKSTDLEIVAYPLTEEHYKNYFIPVDKSKIKTFPVDYDKGFINLEYLPKLKYLNKCLNVGAFPDMEAFNEEYKQ